MTRWSVKDKIPGGVIPKNAPAFVGLGVGGFLILVMMFTGSGQPEPVELDLVDPMAVDPAVGDVGSIVSQVLVDGERLREELEREAAAAEAARAEEEEARLRAEAEELQEYREGLEEARAALVAARELQERGVEGVMPAAVVREAVRSELETVGELELREALRLEEIDRFARSIRSSSVIGAVGPAAVGVPAGASAPVLTGNPEFDEQLMSLIQAQAGQGGGVGQAAAVAGGRQSAPPVVMPGPGGAGAVPPPPGPGGRAGAALSGADLREVYTAEGDRVVPESTGGGTAAVARWAEVPEGMDLIYEGRMLQGTLVTQLTGDFTGPARALITVPVRSRDRRRVVIPVGTEVLGEARAVEGGFQGRLAVGFSRLVFPDGRSVRMSFEGLSSLGETGLADEVDRHYVSTLGAVGAVGLLAGLSASGGTGGQAYFDPAQQQFSLAAMEVLGQVHEPPAGGEDPGGPPGAGVADAGPARAAGVRYAGSGRGSGCMRCLGVRRGAIWAEAFVWGWWSRGLWWRWLSGRGRGRIRAGRGSILLGRIGVGSRRISCPVRLSGLPMWRNFGRVSSTCCRGSFRVKRGLQPGGCRTTWSGGRVYTFSSRTTWCRGRSGPIATSRCTRISSGRRIPFGVVASRVGTGLGRGWRDDEERSRVRVGGGGAGVSGGSRDVAAAGVLRSGPGQLDRGGADVLGSEQPPGAARHDDADQGRGPALLPGPGGAARRLLGADAPGSGEGGRIDFSAFNQQSGLADPRTIELADCPDPLPDDASAVCRPTALPAAGTVYRDVGSLTAEQATELEEAHALRAAEFEVQLAEADHRERLAEEALVAIALYSGCEDDQDDADRRGVVVCPSSRSWTADEREGLQSKLQDSIANLNTVDCPAGTGACPSQAQHRSLTLAVAQAEANLQALWLKLDAEEADAERREAERELLEEARLEAVKVARLQALADFNTDPTTPEGAALLFPSGLDGQSQEPIGVRVFVYAF